MTTVNIATAKNGMVGESEITYAPPDAGDDTNLNDLAKSVIDEIQGEFDEANGPKWGDPFVDGDDTADGADPAQTSQSGEPSAEPKTSDGEEEELEPKQARAFERVVQRELAAKESESKAAARVAELDAKIKEFQGLQGLKSTKELMELARLDPVAAMKELGQDPIAMTKLALAQQLGDKAPQDLKDFAREYSRDREVRELRAQIARQEQSRAQQEYFNTVVTGAREYVSKSVGDSTPTLAAVVKANPDRAHKEIMEEILKDASTRGPADPNGEPMTYQEAAKRVEERLAEWKVLLSVPNSTTTASTKSTQKPNVTAPPQPKPPARPIRPWEQKNNLEEQGLQEALREFHKMEAVAKSQRR